MHRNNVAEIELQGTTGRKVFVLLLRELRCALNVSENCEDVESTTDPARLVDHRILLLVLRRLGQTRPHAQDVII